MKSSSIEIDPENIVEQVRRDQNEAAQKARAALSKYDLLSLWGVFWGKSLGQRALHITVTAFVLYIGAAAWNTWGYVLSPLPVKNSNVDTSTVQPKFLGLHKVATKLSIMLHPSYSTYKGQNWPWAAKYESFRVNGERFEHRAGTDVYRQYGNDIKGYNR